MASMGEIRAARRAGIHAEISTVISASPTDSATAPGLTTNCSAAEEEPVTSSVIREFTTAKVIPMPR